MAQNKDKREPLGEGAALVRPGKPAAETAGPDPAKPTRPVARVEARPKQEKPRPPAWLSTRTRELLFWAGVVLCVLLVSMRLIHLGGDFPAFKDLLGDGVLYSDEGWYAGNAINYWQTGEWHRPGGLNFAVNLPVLQLMHLASFAVFGMNIVAARLTVFFSFVGTMVLMYFILRRFEDRWTGLFAVGIVSVNFLFLIYSRLALAEIPMTFWIMVSLYLAVLSNGRKGWVLSGLAGLAYGLALYTKTSAIFAFPLLMAALFLTNLRGREKWLKLVPALVVFVIVVVAHFLLLARRYPDDFAYFHTLNVGLQASLEPSVLLDYGKRLIDRVQIVDRVYYRVMRILVPLMILFDPRFRRNPLVWFSVAWVVIYMAMFTFYVNLRPRYWPPLMVPYGILSALILKHLYLQATRHLLGKVFLVGFIALTALGVARQARQVNWYLTNVEYSFREFAAEIHGIMSADPEWNNVLLGHFAPTVSLYEQDVIGVTDRYLSGSLAEQIERYQPRYMITEDHLDKVDFVDEEGRTHTLANLPGSYPDRLETLSKYYEVELVDTFDVYRNYMGWQIWLYRLEPRPELGW